MPRQRDYNTSRNRDTLLKLVKQGAGDSFANIPSGRLGHALGLTQQAASRRLIDLEDAGLITRVHAGRSLKVRLTPDGERLVRNIYGEIRSAFEKSPWRLTFTGVVFSGIGKGRYYVGHPEYQKRFDAALGYRPFPGTLNVKFDDPRQREQMRHLGSLGGTRVLGFTRGKEEFSALNCFGGSLDGERVTLLMIDITHYNDSVAELISPVYLRGKLKLKDGDRVTFTIEA
jgi:riboflavin kinase, archaea type